MMKCFKPYDVFISHAAEDKIDLADEIKQSLRQSGLRVWYSADQLPLGESILTNVRKGLRQCRYGVVILSEHSLQSQWIVHELFTMMERKETIIIPIRHNVTSDQVKLTFPGIANIYNLSTANGLDTVISRLKAEIKSKTRLCAILSLGAWIAYKNRQSILQFCIGALTLGLIILTYLQIMSGIPSDDTIEQAIQKRIRLTNNYINGCNDVNILSFDSISSLRKTFDQQSPSSDRHAFEFSSGTKPPLHSKVSLKQAGIPLDQANVTNAYGFHHFTTCVSEYSFGKDNFSLHYSFINTDSVIYRIINTQHVNEQEYQVTVSYSNFIRAVNVACSYDVQTSSRSEKIKYIGLNHTEKLVFEKRDGEWQVTGYY